MHYLNRFYCTFVVAIILFLGPFWLASEKNLLSFRYAVHLKLTEPLVQSTEVDSSL
jgi:hypothetical protein